MFALERINQVSIKKSVFQIVTNNKCPFKDFFEECKQNKQLENQLGQIQSILMSIGKDEENKIPPKKFKCLRKNGKDPHKDYEIKTKDLRVYLFIDSKYGKIVVLGGQKKTQKKDISRLRKIKKGYFDQQEIEVITN